MVINVLMKKLFLVLMLAVAVQITAVPIISAQPKMQKVQILLIPNDTDAVYTAGEKAKVKVMVLHQGVAIKNPTIKYEVSEDFHSMNKEG